MDSPPPLDLAALRPLPRGFYRRDTHLVANELLGKLLVRRWRGELLVGRITETESYVGPDDMACHAANGRRTARTEIMYGDAGHAYVYLIYGIYELINFITERPEFPAAVLVRSLEPLAGIDAMRRARGLTRLADLTTGPGKLTQALRITRTLNHEDVTASERLFIADDPHFLGGEIVARPRIGVDYAGADALLPWRYYLKDNPFISRK